MPTHYSPTGEPREGHSPVHPDSDGCYECLALDEPAGPPWCQLCESRDHTEDACPVYPDEGCEGHPAGPFDPMGETVYCDGTCRR